MNLLDLLLQEYFAIVERLLGKVATENEQIVINSSLFYSFLDKNLYIKRNDKLRIYKQLNMIVCNSNGYTSVMYDKETKKTQRKVILNIGTYKILKILNDTPIKGDSV